jgi:hypothetical protein
VNENYIAVQEALGLSDDDLAQLARNSFDAAFLPLLFDTETTIIPSKGNQHAQCDQKAPLDPARPT